MLLKRIKDVWVWALLIAATLLSLPAFAGQATLAWNASASTNVSGYKVHYGTAAGNYTVHLDVGNVLTAVAPSLTGGTTYYFAVTAYNSAGESPYSNEVSALIPLPPDAAPPSVPTGLKVAAFTNSMISLSWNVATDDRAGAVTYEINGCTGAGCTTMAPVGTSSTLTFTHNGLTPDTSYSYCVKSVDIAGNKSACSAVVTQKTAPIKPAAPSNLRVTATSGT